METVICAHCLKPVSKNASAINRAINEGARLYCSKTCSGLGRRNNKTPEQKKEEKRLYDLAYREKNLALIKAKKAESFKRTYDPVAAAVKRKETMSRHVEYCQRPEYKEWKQKYDQKYRAKKEYGEFSEAFLLLLQIGREVESRASKYEIGLANGTINKAQTRRRNHGRTHSNQS